MAAGLGFKDFTTGEVLTAADVDGYLMQGIWVFANATARDAAVTAPAEGNFAFTKDNNSLWYYDGAAWVASGATGDIEGVTAGVGISGGGTSGTVTVTNSMATAIDAKGDLVVGTGADTFARLAVGTNGHTLVADSAETTGLKWAAASSGALTLVKRSSFSNVAGTSTTFDGVFTSTYKSYLLIIESIFGADSADDLQVQFRYAGPTTQTSNYFGYSTGIDSTGAAKNTGSFNTSQLTIADNTGADATYSAGGYFYVSNVGNSSVSANITGQFVENNNGRGYTFYGVSQTPRTYTGFLLKSSSSNITGTVAVYGLAAA